MAVKTRMPTSDLALHRTPDEHRPETLMNLRQLSFLLFGIALVLSLAMFVFGWLDPWDSAVEYVFAAFVIWALLTAVIVVSMIALAAIAEDSMSRWSILSQAAVVLLMASGLNILSFGILVAPFGIVLLAVSLVFLFKSRLTGPRST